MVRCRFKVAVLPKPTDLVVLGILVAFSTAYAFARIDWAAPPFEDAAILMRYADHFAQGHGIKWNIDGPPVDGATDFLFLVLVGLGVRLGISLETATRAICLISHLTTVVLIYLSARRISKAPIAISLIPSIYFASGPGLSYITAYFGTSFFALGGSFSWFIVLCILNDVHSDILAPIFSISCLITSLIRPEGVILTFAMLLSIIINIGFNRSKKIIIWYVVVFMVLGGIYFLWRWSYFGYPLPNPFYKKGGGRIYLGGLQNSVELTIRHAFPFLPSYFIGIYDKKNLRFVIGSFLVVACFSGSFILLSSEMNFQGRFQYVTLSITLMSWWMLIKSAFRKFSMIALCDIDMYKRISVFLLIVFFVLGSFLYQNKHLDTNYYYDGRYEVALMLSGYRGNGYSIAVTEAGLLPLYSGWRALDTWGLNDQWIAHHGGITRDYLDQYEPEIIMWHGYDSPITEHWAGDTKDQWYTMVRVLEGYVKEKNYLLAAVFGDSPYDTHYYYVKPNFKDSDEIIEKLQNIDYIWYGTGRHSINYGKLDS